MQTYDIIMLAVLLITIFFGYRRGLVWQIASLSAIFVSYFVAIRFRDVVAARLDADPPWNTFLAMLILYAVTSLAVWFVFQFIKGLINRSNLKDFDRQMGALFGALKGLVLCAIITLFSMTLLSDKQKQQVINSRSGYFIARVLDRATMVMPEELSQVLGPYLEKLDESLDGIQQKRRLHDALADQIDKKDTIGEESDFPASSEIFPADDDWPLYREESNAFRGTELPARR